MNKNFFSFVMFFFYGNVMSCCLFFKFICVFDNVFIWFFIVYVLVNFNFVIYVSYM